MVHRSGPGRDKGRGGSRRQRTNSWSLNERPKPRHSRSDAERVLEVPIPPQRSTTVLSTSTDSPLRDGPYQYHALNHAEEEQFRLLTLYPGSGTARITCTLTQTHLRNPHRRYVALSYCWGGAPKNCLQPDNLRQGLPLNHIDIDGFQVPVEDNLYNALYHLRRPTHTKVFWIDALCIDQYSLEERRHQVDLMKRIYENAHKVIGWIGDHERGSLRIMTLAYRIFIESNAIQRHNILLQALRSKEYEFCDAYREFFARSYWHRSWIIQEIFSATRLQIKCCRTIVPWDALVGFQQIITTEFFGSPVIDQRVNWRRPINRLEIERTINSADRFVDLSRLRGARDGAQNPIDRSLHTLETLLFQHWNAAASDPRDKVYSIFRMASDGDDYDIVADYGPEATATELFTNIVKQTIDISGSLSIILPRRRRNQTPHLPSWVPDWSATTADSKKGNWADVYPFQVSPHAHDYCAALLSRAVVRYSQDSMLVLGVRLDEARHISRHQPEPLEIETRPGLLDWVGQLLSWLCFGPQPEPRNNVQHVSKAELWYIIFRRSLRRTYSLRIRNRSIPRDSIDRRSFYRYCRQQHIKFFWILHRATNVQSHESPRERQTPETGNFLRSWIHHGDIPALYHHDLGEEMTPALRNVADAMGPIQINENYTNFFVTREGHMGLGPARMAARDRICLLYGCAVPVVLRWEGFRNRLLGQCYVAGAMFGEVFDRRMSDEEFEIF